jgi:hypothetical protein
VKLMTLVGLVILSAGCGLLNNDSTSPSTPTTITDTWSNTLAVKGTSFYTFTVASAGPVSVTLSTLSRTSTVAVGLGLGTPNGTASCTLSSSTSSAIAASTPQITVTENAGTYCAQIYDVGNLTTASSFTITIVHP